MRQEARLVVVVMLAALLPACTTVNRSVTAIAPPSEHPGRKASRSVSLHLDEKLRAELRATDAVTSGEAAPAAPPLGLSIGFETKVLGYSFDAGQLVLRDREGGEWRPVEASAGSLRYGECTRASSLVDVRGQYVPLAAGTCVVVRFDRAVASGDRLDLVIAGAALGQRRLEPVTVPLVRVESSRREATPALVDVLTLPLKILLFPLAMYGGG